MTFDPVNYAKMTKLEQLLETMKLSVSLIAADIETLKIQIRALGDEQAKLQAEIDACNERLPIFPILEGKCKGPRGLIKPSPDTDAETAAVYAAAQALANEDTSEGERKSETMPSPTTETP